MNGRLAPKTFRSATATVGARHNPPLGGSAGSGRDMLKAVISCIKRKAGFDPLQTVKPKRCGYASLRLP